MVKIKVSRVRVRRKSVYNIVGGGVEMAKLEKPRGIGFRVLGRGSSPPHQLRVWTALYKLRQWGAWRNSGDLAILNVLYTVGL